jgi:hypothetical protein
MQQSACFASIKPASNPYPPKPQITKMNKFPLWHLLPTVAGRANLFLHYAATSLFIHWVPSNKMSLSPWPFPWLKQYNPPEGSYFILSQISFHPCSYFTFLKPSIICNILSQSILDNLIILRHSIIKNFPVLSLPHGGLFLRWLVIFKIWHPFLVRLNDVPMMLMILGWFLGWFLIVFLNYVLSVLFGPLFSSEFDWAKAIFLYLSWSVSDFHGKGASSRIFSIYRLLNSKTYMFQWLPMSYLCWSTDTRTPNPTNLI